MKKLFYIGALSALLLAACGGSDKEAAVTVTPDEFNKLEKGMSLEEVSKIIGDASENLDEKENDDLLLTLDYDGKNGVEKDSSVHLIFYDGKLDTIIENGLISKEEEPATTEPEDQEEGPSEDQTATIEAFQSNDFMKFANAFYDLTGPERSEVYSSTVEGATVTWTGTIADLETIKDSIVVMGKMDAYNGADWTTLGNENADLIPYVIIVEMSDPSVKSELKKGDPITVKGEIGARGDKEAQFNWKLYKGEVVK
ncbi:hypothetical protein [Lysinibacillus odysseyi]|uniref:hypothetical protein n=1 Tax=Lysinibacillus odysseyi TaxID=202611 RepID=UPI0006907BCE|nr:hypothetical protein [Lysinibacillus odysseyi]